MIKLETERLLLRPFEMSDAESMFLNWAGDPEVVRFLPYEACENIEAAQIRIDQRMRYFSELGDGCWCVFAITLKSSGEVIGTIEFAETDHEARSAEVSYQLGRAWWGMGYATEALVAILSHCFETVELNRIWAVHDPRNPASGKIMVKAGMLYEGTLRQCKVRKGELVDRVYHAILKEDWDKMPTKKQVQSL